MVFISSLVGATEELLGFGRAEANIVYIPIGRDFFAPVEYNLFINIYPSGEGTEFVFGLAIINTETLDINHTFDSNEANSIIPRQHRPKVLEVLLRQSERLIRSCNRDAFYMVTYLEHLPPKAIKKYHMLCEVFEGCGYDVHHSMPDDGNHIWRMTRKTRDGVDSDVGDANQG